MKSLLKQLFWAKIGAKLRSTSYCTVVTVLYGLTPLFWQTVFWTVLYGVTTVGTVFTVQNPTLRSKCTGLYKVFTHTHSLKRRTHTYTEIPCTVSGRPYLYVLGWPKHTMDTPYMTVYLVISLSKIPYIHRIYMVLANPTYKWHVYALRSAWVVPSLRPYETAKECCWRVRHTMGFRCIGAFK